MFLITRQPFPFDKRFDIFKGVCQKYFAEVNLNFIQACSPHGSQGGHDVFIETVVVVKGFYGFRQATLPDIAEVGCIICNVQISCLSIETMRRRTDPDIRNATPVIRIMDGVFSRFAIVGNLIMFIP
ncbi:hypothetical protein D3C85_1558090 [compost metagenome]